MVGGQVRQFQRVLVANRGEIACRIFRTLKKLNIVSVGVCSNIDVKSQHALMADQTFLLPGKTSTETYLNIPKILDIIEKNEIDAVHPGYGFLSENYEFAQSLSKNNVVFIGPSVQALKDMGSKSAAKKIMEKAGVPVVPGYHGEEQDPSFLLKKAEEIGFPVMIKAVLGGGGKGMKICHSKDTFFDLLESAKRESKTHFRDEKVILEKYIARSRHIEVQIFGDNYGNVVHLYERDCSVQRRHQKVLEESPSKALTEEERQKLGEMAVLAGKAVNYRGAGTVEFIYDCDEQKFYFMEMNTRLQVEHPVTEMVTGQDLVEWQLKVASGQPLHTSQDQIRTKGHAIEARIYSENTENSFLPDIGRLTHLDFPTGDSESRIESGVKEGDEITMHYDPMIAKVICYGEDREDAIRKLEDKLSKFLVSGVKTNIEFVRKVLNTKEFRDGEHDTGFIGKNLSSLLQKRDDIVPQNIALVFSALISSCNFPTLSSASGMFDHKFVVGCLDSVWVCKITSNRGEIKMEIQRFDDKNKVVSVFTPSIIERKEEEVKCLVNGKLNTVLVSRGCTEEQIAAFINGNYFEIKIASGMRRQADEGVNKSQLILSPMPSKVSQIKVKEGQEVKKGDVLITLEAMKMEHAVLSTNDGVIKTVHCIEGQMVSSGYTLVSFKDNE